MEQSTFQTEGFRPTIQTGVYRHYSGKMYAVLGVARHSETGEWYVVYQKQYDDHGLAIRPYGMFTETLMHQGKKVPRFAFVAGALEPTDAGPDHYAGIFTPKASARR